VVASPQLQTLFHPTASRTLVAPFHSLHERVPPAPTQEPAHEVPESKTYLAQAYLARLKPQYYLLLALSQCLTLSLIAFYTLQARLGTNYHPTLLQIPSRKGS